MRAATDARTGSPGRGRCRPPRPPPARSGPRPPRPRPGPRGDAPCARASRGSPGGRDRSRLRPRGSGRACRCRGARRGSSYSSTGRVPRRPSAMVKPPRAAPRARAGSRGRRAAGRARRSRPPGARGRAWPASARSSRKAGKPKSRASVEAWTLTLSFIAPGSRAASASAAATHARSIAASARFLRTYSNSTAGRSAFVPLRPADQALEAVELQPPGPHLEDGLENDREAARFQQRIEQSGVRWHVLRFCSGRATRGFPSPTG